MSYNDSFKKTFKKKSVIFRFVQEPSYEPYIQIMG